MPDLVQDDQLVLIKAGFFEVWLTRMARMFNQMENYVTFEDGSMIHRDELSVVYAVSIRTKVLEEEVFYAPCVKVSFFPSRFFPRRKNGLVGQPILSLGKKTDWGSSSLYIGMEDQDGILGPELAIDPPPPPGGILYTMIF